MTLKTAMLNLKQTVLDNPAILVLAFVVLLAMVFLGWLFGSRQWRKFRRRLRALKRKS